MMNVQILWQANSMQEQALRPRDRRQLKSRQRILDAALDLVAKDGLEALSLRKIALHSDYSPAALYEYFDSKEAIIEALCLHIDGLLGAYLNQTDPALEPTAGLVEIGMRYIAFASDNPREYQLLRLRRPIVTDARQDEVIGAYAILTSAVQRLGTQPVPLDVAGFAYACWSFVHGLATLQNHLGDATGLDFAAVQRAALHRFIEAREGEY